MLPYQEYLNSLPKKRMAAGCLLLDEMDRILLVKPTYIEGWSMPGGVVEENESPKACCKREVREEIGLELDILNLLIIDYAHPKGKDTESLVFIFCGGKHTHEIFDHIKLQLEELSEYHFFSITELPQDMPSALRKCILLAYQQVQEGGCLYLEDQVVC